MHRFFVQAEHVSEDLVKITGTDVNHINNVLRMNLEDHIQVCDGKGNNYLCSIISMDKKEIKARILECQKEDNELPVKLYLFQGLPKGDKFELIIQKAVELGVFEIIPVVTKRTVVKLDSKKEQSKQKRWNQIIESAAKQSKRSVLPVIKPVMSFKQAIEYAGKLELNLIPYENAQGIDNSRKIVGSAKEMSSVGIFIGPEGGFDEEEIKTAAACGVQQITLGKRILRTETAGLTVLSVLMFNLDAQ